MEVQDDKWGLETTEFPLRSSETGRHASCFFINLLKKFIVQHRNSIILAVFFLYLIQNAVDTP